MRIRTFAGCLAGTALAAGALAPTAAAVVRPEPRAALTSQPAVLGTSNRRSGIVPFRHAPIANKAGVATIFTTDAGNNTVYGFRSTGGSPTFVSSTGVSEPQGLAATKKQVYVANTGDENVLVFRPPATTPVATIPIAGEYPSGVAVTPDGSQIWVSSICNATSCGAGDLREYTASGGLVQTITCSNMYRYYFVAVDKAGDVALDGENPSSAPVADYIKAGQTSCVPLPVTVSFPGGLAFTDKGNLAILDQGTATIRTYAKPSYSKVVATTELNDAGDTVEFAFQGNKDADLWATGTNGLLEFAYPAGGNSIFSIGGVVEPSGVAVMPPAKVGK